MVLPWATLHSHSGYDKPRPGYVQIRGLDLHHLVARMATGDGEPHQSA